MGGEDLLPLSPANQQERDAKGPAPGNLNGGKGWTLDDPAHLADQRLGSANWVALDALLTDSWRGYRSFHHQIDGPAGHDDDFDYGLAGGARLHLLVGQRGGFNGLWIGSGGHAHKR